MLSMHIGKADWKYWKTQPQSLAVFFQKCLWYAFKKVKKPTIQVKRLKSLAIEKF